MADYKNREELQKAINEGYFGVNSYEKISQKSMLLEKILNMAKNDKDDIFRQLNLLVEDVLADEVQLTPSIDVDRFITKSKSEEDMKSAVLDKLPITTLGIKKLDGENVESLKWLLVKKLGTSFDKKRLFELSDSEFKKMLCSLLRGEQTPSLKTNETDFTNKAVEDNTVEPLVESFIKYAGLPIKEETQVSDDKDNNNYYYLIKKQIDSLGENVLKEKINSAYSTISLDSVGKDPIDMIDEVPEKIKGNVQIAYIKDMIKKDEQEDISEDNPLDTNEDAEFSEIAKNDEKLSEAMLSVTEQIERQNALTEELKQLYIIKKTKEQIMLESSHILKDINYKKALLTRTLIYEEAFGKKDKKKYCEKLIKINTLVECLVRKYLPTILE
jgi:hypothetical protein